MSEVTTTKQYVGDGVYVAQGRFTGEVILTTENGVSVQNRIFLDPSVTRNLIAILLSWGDEWSGGMNRLLADTAQEDEA